MKAAIYFNELQPLLYGYYICKGVIFLHRKISAAVFTVLTAMFMCGCTSDKNTVGQSAGHNDRGGVTPAETAFLTDGKEKVCYGQGYETDSDNRPVGAIQAQETETDVESLEKVPAPVAEAFMSSTMTGMRLRDIRIITFPKHPTVIIIEVEQYNSDEEFQLFYAPDGKLLQSLDVTELGGEIYPGLFFND